MTKYRCWDPSYEDEEDGRDYEPLLGDGEASAQIDIEHAAELYAAHKRDHDFEYEPDEIHVRCPDGSVVACAVSMDYRPEFSATCLGRRT